MTKNSFVAEVTFQKQKRLDIGLCNKLKNLFSIKSNSFQRTHEP